MTTIELILTGMAFGGDAIGRHEGQAIFVPFGIPGERVRVRITQNKGRFARAEIVDVLEPSPHRQLAPCPHYGRCGGCHFQHIDIEKQSALKQQIVKDQLERIGGIKDAVVHPTLLSPEPYHYRSHVTFHINRANQPSFVALDDERRLIPVQTCLLMRPELAEFFSHLRVPEQAKRLRLQVGSTGHAQAFVMDSADADNDSGTARAPETTFTYTIKQYEFRCTAGSFFQVNLPQAEALVDTVLKQLKLQGTETVLDLYSGVGLFTAFLAESVVAVHSVESASLSVADAKHNLSAFSNITIHEGTAESVLPTLQGSFDAAVIDPPRTGMHPTAREALVRLRPERIVYVSCDPATLARDAKPFAQAGYSLQEAQPVDMFPQTYHIETVALFSR